MEWLIPLLSGGFGLALLETGRWALARSSEKKSAKGKREENIEDEYRGDLKSRVDKLETRLARQEKEHDEKTHELEAKIDQEIENNREWQRKYYELKAGYKIIEIQNKSERTMREQLEWRVKDLEARLNLELKDDE